MVEFILNNTTIRTAVDAGMPLLDFIRYHKRLIGTKVGCREGDCGACTVLVGTLQDDGQVMYQSITSCISPLGNANGKHIITVEGTNLIDRLTVVQQAMKDNYATQCGFCTPGFVMSLTGFSITSTEKDIAHALDAISGNICRCTGYKSIVNAANQVCQSFKNRKVPPTLDWLVSQEYIPEYFITIPERIIALNIEEQVQTGTVFVSGGTDLYVQKADALQQGAIRLIGTVNALRKISIKEEVCTIGAGATVSDLWNHKRLNLIFPKLKEHLKLVSSEQIRNMASFGGNIVNASPIGDMILFFLALDSILTIRNSKGEERTLPLQKFYKSYKNFDLKEGELITTIQFTLPNANSKFNFEKVCKRTHLDIASVNSALQIVSKELIIEDIHIAIGGVAATPMYPHKTIAFLKGKELSKTLLIEANKVLQYEIAPIADVRGTVAYKRLLARQLFFAHFTTLYPYLFKLTDFLQDG